MGRGIAFSSFDLSIWLCGDGETRVVDFSKAVVVENRISAPEKPLYCVWRWQMPIKQVDVKQASISTQLTPEELEAFKKRGGVKAARESGIIIEVVANV